MAMRSRIKHAVAFCASHVPREAEFWVSVFIVALASATLLAYRRLDRHQGALRFYTRHSGGGDGGENDSDGNDILRRQRRRRRVEMQLRVAVMTACLVVLSAAAAFGTRYIVDTCVKRVTARLSSGNKS